MEIGKRIQEVRNLKKESQQQIADLLKTTQQQIHKYETGKQEIPAYRIKELCKHWEVSANYLLDIPEYPNLQ